MSALPEGLQLEFNGLTEAGLYHDSSRRGYFSVLWREPEAEAFNQFDIDGDWHTEKESARGLRQESYPLERMAQVIPMLRRDRDTYISQAEFFRRNRQLVNLARLPLCFVDVDTYRSEYAGFSIDHILRDIRTRLSDEGLPHPSIALSSGRGLQLKWLLSSPLPRQALPRWTAVQRELCKVLEPFGGDMKALDGSRVLRLVGTVNTKSRTFVDVVYTQEINGRLAHFSFDELADAALPYTRRQLEEMRDTNAKRARAGLVLIKGGRYGLKRGTWTEYNWLRLEDFRQLAQMRYQGAGAPEGWRDAYVFQMTLHTALALGGVSAPGRLLSEAVQLAKEVAPSLSHREAQAYVSTVAQKAKMAAAGETVMFNGRKYTPLYTYSTGRLLDEFKIEPFEQRQLKVLIAEHEVARRHRERETQRRRETGAMERAAYLASAAGKAAEAHRMRQEGLSQREIADRLGVTQPAVSGYLRKPLPQEYKSPCA